MRITDAMDIIRLIIESPVAAIIIKKLYERGGELRNY